jgi:histidine ammonia-lyase
LNSRVIDIPVVIDAPLTSQSVAAVAAGAELQLSPHANRRIAHARALVDVIVERGIRAYGVNTGVGALCDTLLDASALRDLSRNIVMSHACGVGMPLSIAQTRAIMACAINNFAHGGSGIRPVIVDRLLALLNANLIPRVPRAGSIGYLTHMAHIALVLLGEGTVHSAGGIISARAALELLGANELALEAKEGLSLVNGTPDTTGLACVALEQLATLLDWADLIAAMTIENVGHGIAAYSAGTLGFTASEHTRRVGARLTHLLAGSAMLANAQLRTQDAMSLRAVPQVHGAVRGCCGATVEIVDRELASVTDNPIVAGTLDMPAVYAGAHAIASGLALSLDGLAIAVAKIAAMSERRIDRLVNPLVSGLAPFLAEGAGVSSGFMIAQYTALSLASENRRLAAPSSLDGGVSSGLQEDEIPHATTGALRLLDIIANFEMILGIELLAAAQAYECHTLKSARAPATERVYRQFREVVPHYSDDRPLGADMQSAAQFLRRPAPLDELTRG